MAGQGGVARWSTLRMLQAAWGGMLHNACPHAMAPALPCRLLLPACDQQPACQLSPLMTSWCQQH